MSYDLSKKWPETFITPGEPMVPSARLSVELYVGEVEVCAAFPQRTQFKHAERIQDGHRMRAYSDAGRIAWGHWCGPGECGKITAPGK
jgi:hypothetical protein